MTFSFYLMSFVSCFLSAFEFLLIAGRYYIQFSFYKYIYLIRKKNVLKWYSSKYKTITN